MLQRKETSCFLRGKNEQSEKRWARIKFYVSVSSQEKIFKHALSLTLAFCSFFKPKLTNASTLDKTVTHWKPTYLSLLPRYLSTFFTILPNF